MIEYKDIQFYNDYCDSLEDFTLIEPFVDEKGTFVGKIMPNKSLYKLEISVYIPQTFPHNKLIFTTRSLYGYPHLIPYYNNPSLGSWFCLNTAFAETAEQQLDEEFDRLREWISMQLHPELPQHIEDKNTISALRTFNIYEGNNADELNEIRNKGDFTFIGDFALEPKNFDKCGYLNVIKHPDGKFTAMQKSIGTNNELPYIIVDHLPQDIYSFASWVDEFQWDEKICDSLLPDFGWRKGIVGSSNNFCRDMPAPYTSEKIEEFRMFLKSKLSMLEIPASHKEYMSKGIDSTIDFFTKTSDTTIDGYEGDGDYYDPEDYEYNLHFFAIGVINEGTLNWYLVETNRNASAYKEYTYDLEKYTYTLREVVDVSLFSFSIGNIIKKEEYFGRGELHQALVSKKVALIGLGAIGSPLAEALVRGGLRELTLWDGEIIEPGNICRSAYYISDIGEAKVFALAHLLRKISPFAKIVTNGTYREENAGLGISKFENGEFYGNINYNSQEKFISSLQEFDLIIDCTASNELLHFLSYAARDVDVLSLCITNQSRDLICISNRTGNPFELRRHYLSCIEQETGNFYSEGIGCYAPTFLATYCDIQALVSLCVRTMNRAYQNCGEMASMIWHYNNNGINVQKLYTYKLDNSPITMTIPDDIFDKIKGLPVLKNGEIGYLLGGYSTDKTAIYVTNAISKINAQEQLDSIHTTSKGIINYVGNICISSDGVEGISEDIKSHIMELAQSNSVDTNNPLLAYVDTQGKVAFSLYIGNELVPFYSEN